MQKLALLGIAILLLMSCGDSGKTVVENIQKDSTYEYGKMPKKVEIDQEAGIYLNDWEAFNEFNRSIDVLYQATTDEDLALAIEDLVAKEKLLAESKYPEHFDISQIKSRQLVMRTFMLKAKGDLDGSRNPTDSMVQLFEANNALRNQFNIIMNNTLKLDFILDEE